MPKSSIFVSAVHVPECQFSTSCTADVLIVNLVKRTLILSCSCDEDNNKLYAVIFGNVSLVHGDPSHPGLQQLLQATIQRCTEDVLSQSAAVSIGSGMKAALITANDSCSSATGIRPAGVWQQVRQAASAGQNRLVHSSWPTREQSPTGVSRPISSLSTDQLQRTGPELSTNTELLASCVSVQAVKTGATFW